MTTPNQGRQIRCPSCGTFAADTDRFCEACGRKLGVRLIALPPKEFRPGNGSTVPVAEAARNARLDPITGTTATFETSPAPDCTGCGASEFDPDGYCSSCGELGPERDRFEADLGPVCVITDRGLLHARNEDSVAAAVVEGGNPERPAAAVIAVCDGVSTSEDPQAASGAAVRAGLDACLSALSEDRSAEDCVMAGLNAAAAAVKAVGSPDGKSPSCTYVSAIVQFDGAGGAQVTVANVGDSRAYWLRDGDTSQRLTVDDSLAQAMVDNGLLDAETAMDGPHAHVLTRWLGADSEHQWSPSCVRSLHTTEPGVLLLCSDGLWNYLPEAAALSRFTGSLPALPAARALVEHALGAGGKDNITVALVPVPSRTSGDTP
ncbi:protein phosphatase 2C domain-containing protein [Nocardia sp. CDC160]|uniref:protein phosphatase 2C domain-containing protein n=1 Tax=Nocardia sp. CDC160 TaxID=3112166 RepID=UPI002DB8294E|nr:protein phosphatase 2C domain-containing protein [Nocardia sp. CDC160]MEC3918948.1 protein phosphatase 2C domain-containing protein [Nocardia sp. CDC160]